MDIIQTKDIFDLYDKEDEKALLVVNEFVSNISTILHNHFVMLQPDVIVIGGCVINYNFF